MQLMWVKVRPSEMRGEWKGCETFQAATRLWKYAQVSHFWSSSRRKRGKWKKMLFIRFKTEVSRLFKALHQQTSVQVIWGECYRHFCGTEINMEANETWPEKSVSWLILLISRILRSSHSVWAPYWSFNVGVSVDFCWIKAAHSWTLYSVCLHIKYKSMTEWMFDVPTNHHQPTKRPAMTPLRNWKNPTWTNATCHFYKDWSP